jgi:hypothetical protein
MGRRASRRRRRRLSRIREAVLGNRRPESDLMVIAVISSALLLAACSGSVQALDIPAPPATSPAPTTTTLAGPTTTAVEAGVAGTPTTTAPAIRPGDASLNGTVFGPEGPVQGATVLAERIVGAGVASATARTASDGSWTIAGILGGQYRIRAWLAPTLAATNPQIVYLTSGQDLSMSIQVSQFKGPGVATAFSPEAPKVGDPLNLAVLVTAPQVGSDGVVRNPPVVGTSVVLQDDPGWTVAGSGTATTGLSGEVIFRLSCKYAGDNPLSIAVGSQPPAAVSMPACTEPPTTTTSTTSTTVSSTQPVFPTLPTFPTFPTTPTST